MHEITSLHFGAYWVIKVVIRPAAPLYNAYRAGFLLPNMTHFPHPTLTVPEQIALLKKRGLHIADGSEATHYLNFIGYYRLSGYLPPFMASTDSFKDGAAFADVLDLYVFDRKLRLITFDAIERIEVALRATITRVLSETYGPHWFMQPEPFESVEAYNKIQGIIKEATLNANPRKQDGFIRDYYQAYTSPEFPPSWMTMEVLSMGAASFTLKLLRIDLQKKIAKSFKINAYFLSSWVHALTYTRNLCAHHSRLWNRTFTIRPREDKQLGIPMTPLGKFYTQSVIIDVLLKAVAPDSHWSKRLATLFAEHPAVDITQMGFPKDYRG
jgi:abortive infection bacteriophage resistance protein